MTLENTILAVAVALQLGFALAVLAAKRRWARDVTDGLVDGLSRDAAHLRPRPGRRMRRIGLVGAVCGLAYAGLARDAVFFVGQGVLVALAARFLATPGDTADDAPGTPSDAPDGPGRYPG